MASNKLVQPPPHEVAALQSSVEAAVPTEVIKAEGGAASKSNKKANNTHTTASFVTELSDEAQSEKAEDEDLRWQAVGEQEAEKGTDEETLMCLNR